MKVRLEERYYPSTRDIEGYMYDERVIDDESDEFKKYLNDFHVLDKYRKRIVSRNRSYVIIDRVTRDSKVAGLSYFSGWTRTDGESQRDEMCYIVVEKAL